MKGLKELLWLTIAANVFALIFWGWGLVLNKNAQVHHTHSHYIVDEGILKFLPPHAPNHGEM